jgi:DnaJ family protein C protein 13
VALRHWRLKTAQEVRTKNQLRPVALRKRRQNLKVEGNWALLYHKFAKDHAAPDLIWNYPVREELREALTNETKLLDGDRDHVVGEICWNHSDFQVQYKSLSEEINIGGYYLRLLLEEDSFSASFVIRNPKDFFGDLYHRFLLTGRADMRGMCLQAMTTVYGRHWEEIGGFSDLKYIVIMLDKVGHFTLS